MFRHGKKPLKDVRVDSPNLGNLSQEQIRDPHDNKNILQQSDYYDDDIYPNFDMSVSATECTGLMPTPPLSEDEEESYSDLYTIPTVSKKVDKGP